MGRDAHIFNKVTVLALPDGADHGDPLLHLARAGTQLAGSHTPLALPQRRVARDRLRGREGLVSTLTRAATRRTAGDRSAPGVWLLHGMGGCGKTSVALEVAHRLTDASTRVWWVSGADAEGLSSALRAVAFAAGARPADFVGAHPADVLWKHLDALTEPWLLVLDNVDDPAVLAAAPTRTADGRGWLRLPARTCGVVLLTSRDSRAARWGDWVSSVGVDALSDEEGAEVLLDLAPRAGTVGEARELAGHLGGLPLALGLAGAYLARALEDPWPSPSTPDTFTAYRRGLNTHLAELASDTDADLGRGDRSRRAILRTFELSLDLLHAQGAELARPLLRLLAAFGQAPIPYLELLKPQLLAASGLFADPTAERLREALDGLAGLGLITIERTRDVEATAEGGPLRWVTMHPIVRAACRGHDDFTATAPEALGLVTALLRQALEPLVAENPGHWPMWRAVAPHSFAALTLLVRCEPGVGADGELITAATEAAARSSVYLIRIGLYGDARAELDAVCRLRARLLGDEHPATIAARLLLAWAMRHDGELAASEELYRLVARTAERVLPYGHPSLQSARTGRARALRELGRFVAAEMELRVALAMRRRDPAASPGSILSVRHELARVAHRRGRFDEAVTELRALREVTGPDARTGELEALAVGLSLTRALRDAGRAEEAEAVAEETVREHQAFLAPDHPRTLAARHERARLLRDHESDRECLEKARDEFTDIWQANERQFGPWHPDTASARHELATVWHLLGDLAQATEHFAAVWEAARRSLGEDHPHVAVCARNLAIVRAEQTDPSAQAVAHDTEQGASTLTPQPDTHGAEIPTVQEALSAESRPRGPAPAVERLLARFAHPSRTIAGVGDVPGGGYSESFTAPSGAPYQPPFSADGRSLLRRTYRPAPDGSPLPGPALTTVTFDLATLQAIATGQEDPALAERLRAQQRGIRVIVLGELLRLAAEAATNARSTTGASAYGALALFDADRVRSLLLRAEEKEPDAVTEVLLHPTVGRYFSHSLGALRAGADTVDLAHLYGIAAAAAIRAGIDFWMWVPVRAGYAHLPTVGAADFRTTRSTIAEVRAASGFASVSAGGVAVPVTAPGGRVAPRWHPAHHIRSSEACGGFDLLLEDVDPHRVSDGPVEPVRLTGAEAGEWERAVGDAGRLLHGIGHAPDAALATVLTSLTPLRTTPGRARRAMSSSDAFGGIALPVPEDDVELAETLVHEFGHMKLHAAMDSVDLLVPDEREDGDGNRNGARPEQLYYAPWREEPRPLSGLLHGVFVHMGVVDFWRRVLSRASGGGLRRAQFELVHWRAQSRDVFTVLRSSPRLTETGRFFVDMMGDTIAAWADDETVPDAVTALAMEAAVAHRLRWRLRHLRPEPAAVAELADAWRAGLPCPDRRPAVDLVVPGRDAPTGDGYRALLRAAATDPAFRRRWLATPAAAVPGEAIAPSDTARLGGAIAAARVLAHDGVTRQPAHDGSWTRLALAWRRPLGTEGVAPGAVRAASSLSLYPEVVRAVHARVTEATGSMPDPGALAAWLAPPGAAVAPPALPPTHPGVIPGVRAARTAAGGR
ncbi:HEXXH motif-containing putative peptide modification protein [Streptomyces sp. NPDC047829]|uniref:aKG-HExxH-type peptide beta-hydroxylase n=1 Tax=Streptomyces sp. NPDC047829 TaxID=3154609 RepID=UPI0033EBB8CC